MVIINMLKPRKKINVMSLQEIHDYSSGLINSFDSKDYNVVCYNGFELERILNIRKAIECLDIDLTKLRELYQRIGYEINYLEHLKELEDE